MGGLSLGALVSSHIPKMYMRGELASLQCLSLSMSVGVSVPDMEGRPVQDGSCLGPELPGEVPSLHNSELE